MKIGFIGTRNGMSESQIKSFESFISSLQNKSIEFHHGDCIGSDETSHKIVESLKTKKEIKIIGHLPKYKKYRAFCKFDMEFMPKDYAERNKNIINYTDILIAVPDRTEEFNSGTWRSIRYAKSQNKIVYIIHKSGRIEAFNGKQKSKVRE